MKIGNWKIDDLLLKYRYPLLILLVGLIITTCGIFIVKSGLLSTSTKVEVLPATTVSQNGAEITAEIAGEVITPGVYKLPTGSRVDDLLIRADGLSAKADRVWTDKYLNRAAKLTDGQKVYIPAIGQQSKTLIAKDGGGDQTISPQIQSDSNALININTASSQELDSLPGIGPTYAQNIIEHRPYSNATELSSKGVLKASVYNKIKDLITVY